MTKMTELDKINEIAWKNVKYEVQDQKIGISLKRFFKKEVVTKTVLNNVSGKLRTGEMVAILGASGAGKTTLMAAITQRIRGNKLKGEFLFNNCPINQAAMTNVAGFVPQYDSAIEMLHVEEHLHFMTELKLASTVSKAEKCRRQDIVMCQLGIKHLAKCRIKNLSGGEKKKLSLATELIKEPMFLFCDEPTTGLDSYNAISVMKTLQNLTHFGLRKSQKNLLNAIRMNIDSSEESEKSETELLVRSLQKGVICSIHQPSSEVFHCFSHIILVDEGSILFQGSTKDAEIFFEKLGFPCPFNYNPAEHFVNLVSPILMYNIPYRDRIEQIKQARCDELGDIDGPADREGNAISFSEMPRSCRLNWVNQVGLLFRRSVLIHRRNYGETLMNSTSNLVIAFMIGILYSGKPNSNQTSIMDLEGLLFTVVAQILFYTYKCVVNTFSPEFPLIRRETGENLYNLSAFYVMKFLNILPKVFLECFLVSLVVYYPTSFVRDFETFISLTMSYFVLGFVAVSYGFMWGCLFGDGLGGEISTPIDLYQMIFSGIYINIGSVPAYLKYFSLFYYMNEALSYQYWINVESIECSTDRSLPCIRNGRDVLKKYSLRTDWYTIFFDYGCLLSWCLLFHFIAFMALKRYIKREGFY